MAIHTQGLLPQPSRTELLEAFVGKKLNDVTSPAAIVDRAVVKRNCEQMLLACKSLGVFFRPHIKTHKTVEVTQAQIGDAIQNVNVVVSTIPEAAHLLEWLIETKATGKDVNILYGIPLPPSQVRRLAYLGERLGPQSISVLVDDFSQLASARTFRESAGFPLHMLIKVDTGYHRAGLPPDSSAFRRLVSAILELESQDIGVLAGFYCHAGHSYGVDSSTGALKLLMEELEILERAAIEADGFRYSKAHPRQYTLSVGATPTATSTQNLIAGSPNDLEYTLRQLISRLKKQYLIELHAGVYPFLDMQQIATRASPSAAVESRVPRATISLQDIALSIIVEVASIYDNRHEPEALIAAGTLAFGREPCKSYEGWGIVSDWEAAAAQPIRESGWMIGRISQEHSILTHDPKDTRDEKKRLRVGQKLRVWPNHACVASAGFSWYLVVDSTLSGDKCDEIVDVWIRCRGW